MEFDQVTCNSIDLIEGGNIIGCVYGPKEGDEDVTETELRLAQCICDAYNFVNGG